MRSGGRKGKLKAGAMGVLPLDQFLCWKLKIATIVFAIYVITFGAVATVLEVLDIIALAVPDFEISGGFRSHWRAHVWEGWLATNIVMIFFHCLLSGYSVLMIFAVKRWPTYYEFNFTKGYLALIIIYILVELGCALYRYSWYGNNTFRLAYLIFTFLFWVIRLLFNCTGAVIVDSRIAELRYEIKYGEKKNMDPYNASNTLLDATLRSGTATPMPRQQYGGPPSTSSYA